MKISNCIYWVSWKIKNKFVGQSLWRLFKFKFKLSKKEILYKYPNLEIEYIEEIKKKLGNNIQIRFDYNHTPKNNIDIYYTVNNKENLYRQCCILIPDVFSGKIKDGEWSKLKSKYNRLRSI